MMDHTVVEKLLQIEIVADEMLDDLPRTARLGVRSILQPLIQNCTDYAFEEAALLDEKALKKCRGAHGVLCVRINGYWGDAQCTEAHDATKESAFGAENDYPRALAGRIAVVALPSGAVYVAMRRQTAYDRRDEVMNWRVCGAVC